MFKMMMVTMTMMMTMMTMMMMMMMMWIRMRIESTVTGATSGNESWSRSRVCLIHNEIHLAQWITHGIHLKGREIQGPVYRALIIQII